MATTAPVRSTPLEKQPGALGAAGDIGRWLAIGMVVLGLAAAVAICSRRLSGAFERPLPLAGLIGAGGVLFLCGELAPRLCARRSRGGASRFVALLAPAGSSLLCAVGVSLPGSPPAGLAFLWSLTLLQVGLSGWRIAHRRAVPPAARRALAPLAHRRTIEIEPPAERPNDDEIEEIDNGSPADDAPLAAGVSQRLSRREEPDGVHWLSGLMRLRFDAGQRVAHAHVAFCPPFLTTPTCAAEAVAGADALVKVTQLLPHGVRFEARLDATPAEATDVVIEFATQWPAAS